jgi:quercetin dioxygenase-like cupin family protein
MNIIKMENVEGIVNKRGVVTKELIDIKEVRVINIALNPGDEVPEHKVPVEVFFFIVEGKGTLQIGSDKAVVQANDIITCPPNTVMSLKADQGEKFSFLNVKTPSWKLQ